MFKKYTAILFLTVAYAILLGHNIIPHHHHATLSEAELHHFYEHTTHHHANGDTDGHEHTPHLVHTADFGEDFRTPTITTIDFAKQIISLFSISPFTFSLIAEANSCLENQHPEKEFLIYSSPHSLSSGLRAPPAFIS
jgi:hypothetical protein